MKRMQSVKKALAIAAVCCGGLLFAQPALSEPGVTDDTILMGSLMAVSGPPSLMGKAATSALKVWQEDVNANGGINGRMLKLITADDGYVPARTRQMAKKLIENDKVFALVGTSGSSHLLAAMSVIDKHKVPAINTMAVNSAHFNPPRDSVFVAGATYCQEIEIAMTYAAKNLGKQDAKFVLIYQDDEFGKDMKCGYDNGIKNNGLADVGQFKFKRGQKDFSAEILKAKATGANVLISGGIVAEHAIFLKEARKIGWDMTLIGMHGAHLSAVQALSGEADNGYYTADYVPPLSATDIPGVKKFMELSEKYLTEKELKGLNRYALSSYAAALMMEHAMRECGKELTRACVIQNLENMNGFDVGGVMSPITYGKGNRFSVSGIMVIQSNGLGKDFKRISDPIVLTE